MRFGGAGELVEVFEVFDGAGLTGAVETTLEVSACYADFDELWSSLEAGIGPAGSYLTGQPPDRQRMLRERMFAALGAPAGGFSLPAVARAARATR